MKLALHSWQLLGEVSPVFDQYTGTPTHTDTAEMVGPHPEFTLPLIGAYRGDTSEHAAAEIDKLLQGALSENEKDKKKGERGEKGTVAVCAELYATRRFNRTVVQMYLELLELKQQDYQVAVAGSKMLEQMKILMRDMMIYLGQEDLVITEAREAKLSQMLTSTFGAAVKNKAKNPEAKRKKHSANKLLSNDVDDLVEQHRKSQKVRNLQRCKLFTLFFFQLTNVVKAAHIPGKSGGGKKKNGKRKPSSDDEDAPKKKRKKKGGRSKAWTDTKTTPSKGKSGRKDGPQKGKKANNKGMVILPFVPDTTEHPLTFLEWVGGKGFLPEALAMVVATGLSLESALELASFPIGGRIAKCPQAWELVTNNHWVLDIVHNGYKVQFVSLPHTPMVTPNVPTDTAGRAILDSEVEAMLAKKAIRLVTGGEEGVISPFFARPKSTPGKWRPIVSLKKVNRHIRKVPFRMVTVRDIRLWLREGYYFTSLDLQDAYFSIPLHHTVYRFTRFVWNDLTYEFLTNMFGLGPSARLFTKVLAEVIRFLRREFGTLLQGYIDDFLFQAMTVALCLLHTHTALIIFHCLGFEVNFPKSILSPSQQITHIGFEWNSVTMTVTLPRKKMEQIAGLAADFLDRGECTARELRSFVGRVEGARPAVEQAALHYRSLQVLLPPAVSWHGGCRLRLTRGATEDLQWWRDSLPAHLVAPMRRGQPTLDLFTDASGVMGWGGHSSRGFAQGPWMGLERMWHINAKELVTVEKCLTSMMEQGDYVHVNMDSRTAVAYINKQGGTRSRSLCDIALRLWDFVLTRGGWIRASWLPRESNQIADMLSKQSLATWEFGLDPRVAEMIWQRWFVPTVDSFASRDFHLVRRYYSFYPDPLAERRDAFSVLAWPDRLYAFPPVPLITLVLEKIRVDRVTAIMIVPAWETAKWWDLLQDLLLEPPMMLGDHARLLVPSEGRGLPHLGTLAACLLRGNSSSS